MVSLTFYFPFDGDNGGQDNFIYQYWKEQKGNIDYLMHVRRVSMRGMPYIRGLIVFDGSATIPNEFEVHEIPDDCVDFVYQQFKEEQRIESNATEFGQFPSRN